MFSLLQCLSNPQNEDLKMMQRFKEEIQTILHKLKELIESSKFQIFFVDFSLEKIVLVLGHCIANQTKILGRYCIYL